MSNNGKFTVEDEATFSELPPEAVRVRADLLHHGFLKSSRGEDSLTDRGLQAVEAIRCCDRAGLRLDDARLHDALSALSKLDPGLSWASRLQHDPHQKGTALPPNGRR